MLTTHENPTSNRKNLPDYFLTRKRQPHTGRNLALLGVSESTALRFASTRAMQPFIFEVRVVSFRNLKNKKKIGVLLTDQMNVST